MPNPKVSILMATWNRSYLIGKAITSIRNQSFKDWELIIIDDGSEDDTRTVVGEWQAKDNRIKYFYQPHTGRIAQVSNFGLSQASGEYVAILDDDDIWIEPDKLKKQVEFLDKNPNYVGCGGGMVVIDEKGKEKLRFLKPERNEEIKENALVANPMANSTTLFRLVSAKKVGFYDENMVQYADWDFWLKMGMVGKLYNFPEYFAYYSMTSSGSSFRNERENALSSLKIVKRYKKQYPHFFEGLIIAYLYYFYSYIPKFIRRIFNPIFSGLKKIIFSGGQGGRR